MEPTAGRCAILTYQFETAREVGVAWREAEAKGYKITHRKCQEKGQARIFRQGYWYCLSLGEAPEVEPTRGQTRWHVDGCWTGWVQEGIPFS